MRVDLLSPSEENAWSAFVESRPDATIYHSLAWREVTREGLGHRPYYLRALSEGGDVVGILPLFLVGGLFGRRLVSVPMRDRAGVLATSAPVARALVERAIALVSETRSAYLELKHLTALEPGAIEGLQMQAVQQWITTRVDLTVGRDTLWKGLDRDAVRWAIGKAGRMGVTVIEDNTADGVERFFEIFSRTRTSMGIPPFPLSLFRAINRHLLVPGKAKLFFCVVGTELINGMINFLSRDTFLPAYAAPQRAWAKHFPSEMIFWHTIEWAAQHGYATYDFGADSPKQEGLLKFKKKWGGTATPTTSYFHLRAGRDIPEFDSSSARYERMRRMWSSLPISVSKLAGAWVTRQLS